MGGFAGIIRSGLRTAKALTKTLEATVTHEAWIGQDAYGKPLYATAIARRALVQEGATPHRLDSGEVITAIAQISFLEPVAPHGAAGRQEPIDVRDRITLRGELTAPIMDIAGGLVDPATGRPYLTEVWLGQRQ